MKIAILGAGAMGSFFGGLLAEAGQPVTLLDVNRAHLDAIARAGLWLRTDTGERRITALRACQPEQAREAPDLLIVFTKTPHTRAAMTGARHLLGPATHVLSLQNGLGNVETLKAFVPRERVLVGMTTWPADLVGPGQVRSHGQGEIRMMSADGASGPMLDAVVALLSQAGLRCRADPDVWTAIWEKVAFNAALNSLCAVTGCSVDQLGLIADGPMLALAIAQETAAVAQARGLPVSAARITQTVRHAIASHHGHKPSMLQDVLAGRPTEIEAINGAVVAAARDAGVAAPRTEQMLHLVRLMDARANVRANACTDTRVRAATALPPVT